MVNDSNFMGMAASGSRGQQMEAALQSLSRQSRINEKVVALYESHRDSIYRFLVGHGLNPFEAQEVTQDVFVDLFVALRKGVDVSSPQGWLYAVAGRAAIDYWRREHRATRIPLNFEQGRATDFPSAEPTPEMTARRREQLRRIATDIGALPKEQRMCIQLRMQGLRYRETSDVMGVATPTVADWLVATIRFLRGVSR